MAAESRHRILVVGPRGIVGCEGGVEKFAEEFVFRVAARADVTTLCLERCNTPLPAGVEVVVAPRTRLLRTDKLLILPMALWLYASRPFDTVFILGMNFAVLIPALRALFWRQARIIVRTGSIDYTLNKWSLPIKHVMRMSEWFMRFADVVIAVAPSLKAHLEVKNIRAVVIRNGLERGAFANANTSVRNGIVAFGRVTPQKNYRALLRAAEQLGARCPRITILGGGDLSGEVTALQSWLRERPELPVTLAGKKSRREVLQALSSHALYVNCSLHEGMSNAVLEAIQQGIPVLLSDIESNRDFGLPDAHYFDLARPNVLAERIEAALANPGAFVAPTERLEDWAEVVDAIARLMGLPCAADRISEKSGASATFSARI